MSAPKKQKVVSAAEALQSRIFSPEFQDELKASVEKAEPYNHGVIHGLFESDVLRAARDEIFANVHFTEKETDIYKLNQTGDLLNLDGLPEQELKLLESLDKVRRALYSQEFRDVISNVTGCGPLSGSKFDLSLNNYNRGCHLLAHDDVIGTRLVSFILYLVPPDYDWQPKWGGALRLYPTLREGVPAADFSAAVPPQWNQLSFFRILPGRSFHDVEEVYVDQPRLSIQGWFHIPQPGEPGYEEARHEQSKEKSTLAQLSQAHDTNDGYEPKRTFEAVVPEEDEQAIDQYLRQYVSPEVLDSVETLQSEFADASLLQLPDFLAPGFWARVKAELEELELQRMPTKAAELREPWGMASPPHLRRYLYLSDTPTGTAVQELKQLFKSRAFAGLLSRLTGLRPKSEHVELRRFRPGHDYTLASVSGFEQDILEAVLSITPAKWDDDVGGYDLVMGGGTDENDDPAVYRQASDDDDGVLLSKIPTQNELTLILRDPDLLRFVKYVSRNARGSRWDVLGQFSVEEDESEEQNAEQNAEPKAAPTAEPNTEQNAERTGAQKQAE